MLYQLHELNRAFLNPMMQWAETSAKLFSDPVSPLAHTPFSQRIAAGYELLYRLSRNTKSPFQHRRSAR
jgi:poly(3-hydroxybutyrate) depolymerase